MEGAVAQQGKDVRKGVVVFYLSLLTAKVNMVKRDMAALCLLTLASVLSLAPRNVKLHISERCSKFGSAFVKRGVKIERK